jgi:hypothetical protein
LSGAWVVLMVAAGWAAQTMLLFGTD